MSKRNACMKSDNLLQAHSNSRRKRDRFCFVGYPREHAARTRVGARVVLRRGENGSKFFRGRALLERRRGYNRSGSFGFDSCPPAMEEGPKSACYRFRGKGWVAKTVSIFVTLCSEVVVGNHPGHILWPAGHDSLRVALEFRNWLLLHFKQIKHLNDHLMSIRDYILIFYKCKN